ncbi:polysaccharide biosynthesis protein [Paenirhodobacter enshiensis]|uniref:polysaccharide biosynthesis protein n=1 Tax=Paenirhodobacter enshiensis TaxID=1105367 RepID=UPI0009DD327C|nr:nucleoside-diphosphate sugar epimerase/dehydratase [Paenirhodobacter enshiensis]
MLKTIISLTRWQKAIILFAVDVALVPLADAVTLLLLGVWPNVLLSRMWDHWPLVLATMVVAGALSVLSGLNRLRLKEYQGDAISRSLLMAVLIGAFYAALGQFLDMDMRIAFHVVFALVYFAGFFTARRVLVSVLSSVYRRSRHFPRVAIYGAGRTGMTLARELKKADDLLVYAFFDDNATLAGMNVNGLPIYPGVRAAQVRDQFKLNRVILAMPSVSVDKQTFISERLARLGLDVQTLPAFTQVHGGEALMSKLMPAGPAKLLHRDPLSDTMHAGCTAYEGANVLITGAGGSIGLELCRQVMACRPARLVLFELSEFALYRADQEMRVMAETLGTEIVPVLGSIADAIHVSQVMKAHDIGIVLHAAAYKHVPLVEMNPRVGMANNVIGTAVLARAAAVAGVRRFVLISSDKAVRPGNLMGASKRMAELIVQDLAARSPGTIYSIVRFGNVMGSSGSVIPRFQQQIARGGPVTLTDLRVTRYFMTIEEASRLVLLAGSFAAGGEVYVLDMGKPVRIADLARRMIESAGYTVRDERNPNGDIEIQVVGLRPGEKLYEELMVRKGAQATAHKKIIRVREDHLSEADTESCLRDLRVAIEHGSDAEVIAVTARMVPEYTPQSLPETAMQCRIVEARRALGKAAQ